MIRIPQVRVIDDEGNQLGVMPTPQTLGMAQGRGPPGYGGTVVSISGFSAAPGFSIRTLNWTVFR